MEYPRAVYSWENIQTALDAIKNYDYEIKRKAQHPHNLYRFAEFIDETLIPLNVGIGVLVDHEQVSAWTVYRDAIRDRKNKEALDRTFKNSLLWLEREIREVIHMAQNKEVDMTA